MWGHRFFEPNMTYLYMWTGVSIGTSIRWTASWDTRVNRNPENTKCGGQTTRAADDTWEPRSNIHPPVGSHQVRDQGGHI